MSPWAPESHKPKPSRKASDRAYDRSRRNGQAKKIRSSARWQKVRAMKLARNPLCEPCQRRGHATVAQQVHHLKPVESHPELALVLDNLESICTRCHARESQKERRRA